VETWENTDDGKQVSSTLCFLTVVYKTSLCQWRCS